MKYSDFSRLEKTVFFVGVIIILFLPVIMSQYLFPSPFDESSSWLGSAIGGITAPIVGVFSGILIYITIKIQIQTNSKAEVRQEMSDQSQILQLYYNSLKSSIDNYNYTGIDGRVTTGSEAIYNFFDEFYCDPHKFDSQFDSNSKITELKSILEILDLVVSNVEKSQAPDKIAILNLAKHQFLYRVFPRLNMPEIVDNQFCRYYCESCQKDHGLPDDFITHLLKMKKNFLG